ncbi:MAG TPA: glycosyltransferase [Candidatus Acidoferrales bacterium]|nr:glycosyltransferase [Candidatus Acidoferrales bacterium]
MSPEHNRSRVMERLIAELIRAEEILNPIVWFYTPMALDFFPETVIPSAVVYDCMDELSSFRGAPQELRDLEVQLLRRADLVFTGGISLFEAKRSLHQRVFPFPSGVDVAHFMKARGISADKHQGVGRPRIGYAGVIDERLDLDLLEKAARRRPDWQFVMIGPIAKIPADSLPRRANIHWMGMKPYSDLPAYFAGWDVAMMPFALNEATRFISPTKTPEFLAAGLPVVSTAIRDVVRPYGELGLVRIVSTPAEFVSAAEHAMAVDMSLKWRERADQFLSSLSWDSVWDGMNRLIAGVLQSDKAAGAGPGAWTNSSTEPARV